VNTDPPACPAKVTADSAPFPVPGRIGVVWLCLPWLLFTAVVLYRLWFIAHWPYDLYVDEAQYWDWAQSLDWGYYSKPPLLAWLMAPALALLGDSPFAVKLMPQLVLVLAALVVGAITGRLATWRARMRSGPMPVSPAQLGAWAALAFLTLPLVGVGSVFVSVDAPLLLFWALALWLALGVLEPPRDQPTQQARRAGAWLALGLVCGLGLLSKYTMLLFAPLLLLAVWTVHGLSGLWRWLRQPGPWLTLALAAALLAPNLLWNAQHGWPTVQHTAEIAHSDAAGLQWQGLMGFWLAQFGVMGPLLFAMALLAIFSGLRSGLRGGSRPGVASAESIAESGVASAAEPTLLAFSLPLLLGFGGLALFGQANANWAATAFVALVPLTWLWAYGPGTATRASPRLRPRLLWLGAALFLNGMVMLAGYHWPVVRGWLGLPENGRTDFAKRARGWTELAEQLRPLLQAHPGCAVAGTDRTITAELRYELRPADVRAWRPHARVFHHFDLMRALRPQEQAAGQCVLLVAAVAPEFAAMSVAPGLRLEARHLGVLAVALHGAVPSGYRLDYTVWRLDFMAAP